MTKLWIVIFPLLSFFSSLAKDYTKYYRHTQLGEEYLLNTEFELALLHYDSALSNNDFKFARDCMIAAQLAAYLNRDVQTFRYLTYCLEAGISLDCIRERKIFRSFFQRPAGYELPNVAEVYRNRYLAKIDTALNREWTARLDREQSVKGGDTTIYFNVLDSNINRITELLLAGRFPGEKVIGVRNSIIPATTVTHSKCTYCSDMAIPSLKHYDYSYEKLKSHLVKAMYEGYINPRELVAIYIFSRYQKGRGPRKYTRPAPKLEMRFEESEDSAIVFNLFFEKKRADIETANYYRHQWFFPRKGNGLNPMQLRDNFGIDIMIGEWNF